jgi:hypothetical protein
MQVDATAPDFWIQVGTAMAERGYHRSPDVCRDEWFKVRLSDLWNSAIFLLVYLISKLS